MFIFLLLKNIIYMENVHLHFQMPLKSSQTICSNLYSDMLFLECDFEFLLSEMKSVLPLLELGQGCDHGRCGAV